MIFERGRGGGVPFRKKILSVGIRIPEDSSVVSRVFEKVKLFSLYLSRNPLRTLSSERRFFVLSKTTISPPACMTRTVPTPPIIVGPIKRDESIKENPMNSIQLVLCKRPIEVVFT